jgi:hypothetical protein
MVSLDRDRWIKERVERIGECLYKCGETSMMGGTKRESIFGLLG